MAQNSKVKISPFLTLIIGLIIGGLLVYLFVGTSEDLDAKFKIRIGFPKPPKPTIEDDLPLTDEEVNEVIKFGDGTDKVIVHPPN